MWHLQRSGSMIYDPICSGFRVVSPKVLMSAIKWFRQEANLRDWDISFEYGDNYPSWTTDKTSAASSWTSESYYKACIFINPNQCKKVNCDPIAVIFHELAHILLHIQFKVDHSERFVNTLEGFFYHAWLQTHPKYNVSKRKKK